MRIRLVKNNSESGAMVKHGARSDAAMRVRIIALD
jgi:hypothetical protein